MVLLHIRQERQADEYTAKLLSTPNDYEAAESLAGSYEGILATELGMTTHLIRLGRGVHERTTT